MSNNISIAQRQSKFLSKVYGWMAIGLLMTAFAASYAASSTPIFLLMYNNRWIFFALLIAQGVMVSTISGALDKISSQTATYIFLAYSILTGLTISSIFFVYTLTSITNVFFITSGMFAGLALYGHYTKSDLSGMRVFLFGALIGLLVCRIFNFFVYNSAFDWITTGIGIIIFSLYTAYDSQKIKKMAYEICETEEDIQKLSIFGALILYLDFINLFLSLLRFIGKRKD